MGIVDAFGFTATRQAIQVVERTSSRESDADAVMA
jgi:hypothetical protein